MTSNATPPIEPDEAQKLFSEFKTAYERADELSKEVQTYRSKASVPSINEMRYAGYHLLHALDEYGSISDLGQIRKAKSHAQRACYEASEAGIAFALREIKLFQSDYKDVIITSDIKNYIEITQKAEEAQKRIGTARAVGDNRTLDHEKHRELFIYLSSAANALNAARPEINKRMRADRTAKKRWIFTTIIALSALVVSLSSLWVNAHKTQVSAPPAANTPSTPVTPGAAAPPP